jgi:hypothetical protein
MLLEDRNAVIYGGGGKVGGTEFLDALPDDAPFFKLGPRATTPTAEFGNRADTLMADIPAGGKMSARRSPHVRRADGRSGRCQAGLAGAAARDLCPGVQRRRPDHGKPGHMGAGFLYRSTRERRARDPDRGRGELRVRRHREQRRVRVDQEQANHRFRRRRAGRRDRHEGRCRRIAANYD